MLELTGKFVIRRAVLFLIAALMALCTVSTLLSRLMSDTIASVFLNVKTMMLLLCFCLLAYRHIQIRSDFKVTKLFLTYVMLFALLCFDILYLVGKYGCDASSIDYIKFKLLPLTGIFIGYVLSFRDSQLRWIKHFFIVIGLISSVIAVIQWMGGPQFFDSIGLSSEIGSEYHFDTAMDAQGEFVFRAFSIFRDHYELSSVLSISILCAIVLFWDRYVSAPIAFVTIIVLFIGLLTTYNMTAWLSLIMTVVAMVLIKTYLNGVKLSPKRLVEGFVKGVVIIGVVVGVFVKLGMLERVIKNTAMGNSSLYYRGLIFLQQIEMISSKPMGWGIHEQSFPKFFTADNYLPYVTVLAGIPWGIIFVVIVFIPLFAGLKVLRFHHGQKTNQFPLALGVYGLVIYVAVGLFSNSPVLTTSYNFVFWISVGWLIRLHSEIPSQSSIQGKYA